MLRYALRRLLQLPLSLWLLTLLCFGLQALSPGDDVAQGLTSADARLAERDPAAYDEAYRRAAARRGLDRPAFYFSLRNAALPDTLHRIVRPGERKMLRSLTLASGDWPAVEAYYRALRRLAYLPDAAISADADPRPAARRLLQQDDPETIRTGVSTLPPMEAVSTVNKRLAAVLAGTHRTRLLLPALDWHGTDNRYHQWLMGVLRGDFGVSYLDRRPVADKLGKPLRRTALLNGLAILVVLLVSVPLGLYTAGHRGSRFDRWTTALLFLLFGIPSFWFATLLANYLTTPAVGIDLFPSMGFGEVPPGADFWEALRIRASHLFLPVFCLAYPSWAYVTQQLRRSAGTEMDKAYIKTARMKGLGMSRILWHHVLRNAAFPIITLLGGILPALLAGSVLIERIFNLPGMGQLLYDAAVGQDWPVVIALVLLNGLLTAAGLLLADLAYALADPRVRLSGRATSLNPVA